MAGNAPLHGRLLRTNLQSCELFSTSTLGINPWYKWLGHGSDPRVVIGGRLLACWQWGRGLHCRLRRWRKQRPCDCPLADTKQGWSVHLRGCSAAAAKLGTVGSDSGAGTPRHSIKFRKVLEQAAPAPRRRAHRQERSEAGTSERSQVASLAKSTPTHTKNSPPSGLKAWTRQSLSQAAHIGRVQTCTGSSVALTWKHGRVRGGSMRAVLLVGSSGTADFSWACVGKMMSGRSAAGTSVLASSPGAGSGILSGKLRGQMLQPTMPGFPQWSGKLCFTGRTL